MPLDKILTVLRDIMKKADTSIFDDYFNYFKKNCLRKITLMIL